MQHGTIFRGRNPGLVLLWTFGLYILMQAHQYVGILLSSLMCGASFDAIIEGEFSNHCSVLWKGLAAAVLGIPLVILVTKYLWRRSWEWMRFRFCGRFFGYGIMLGFILPAFILLIHFSLGMAAIIATPARFGFIELLSIVIGTVGFTIVIALSEELIFRGMAIREWALKMGWPLATLFGGLYFGFVHLIGLLPRISALNSVWIIISALIAGVLFTAMYIRSKSLWLPIGFHFGWNLCLRLFFGTTISGQEATLGLFRTELSGPAILTGGAFGIESSVITYLLYIVVAVLFLRYSRLGRPALLDSRLA
ncbi:MAG: CPBP family intramembrane metalloprotease [candidate division WOR-3 bacterium]|nr:CPBP family intramembrane metalloprotease [candidate division WOR-3 bacterium]